MTERPDPISRRDRQRQTREALVLAARAVFAEVGYHAASLDQIARQAGFSKGAVYSNFENKAALFLAVVDLNIDTALSEGGWDVFEAPESPDLSDEENVQLGEAMTGFALATLEFIAYAARDERLKAEMGRRIEVLTVMYTEMARAARAEGDPLSAEDLGVLLTALDQGSGLLVLAGGVPLEPRVLRTGMRRLLDPARAGEPVGDDAGGTGLHDREVQRRIADALRGLR